VLQRSFHTPTFAAFAEKEWHMLSEEIELRGHPPISDKIVYREFGDGFVEDARAGDLFRRQGSKMLCSTVFLEDFRSL
jgi:aspartate/tyrosine/aromatic aminotransferase